MRRLLLTGASGFLAWNIARQAVKTDEWDIMICYHKMPVQIPGTQSIHLDLRQSQEVAKTIDSWQPDVVIHCAAASQPNFCEQNPTESYEINVIATLNLGRLCRDQGIKMVFTSTDLVFDGTKGYLTEADAKNPISEYGLQKSKAEDGLLALDADISVCRMPLMYGLAPQGATCFALELLRNWNIRRITALFTDEYRSVLYAVDAANGLLWAANHHRGLLHLGGKERCSRYDFGMKLAATFDFNEDRIKPAKQSDVSFAAKRPADVSLSSKFAQASGFKALSLDDGLLAMKEEMGSE